MEYNHNYTFSNHYMDQCNSQGIQSCSIWDIDLLEKASLVLLVCKSLPHKLRAKSLDTLILYYPPPPPPIWVQYKDKQHCICELV